MTDSEEEAHRIITLMYNIILDKNDAKDCAIICVEEMAKTAKEYGHVGSGFQQLVIEEIKKI